MTSGLEDTFAAVRLTLPMPPSGNNRNVGTGKSTRHSQAYEKFLWAVAKACLEAQAPMLAGKLRSHVAIYYDPAHEPDCDNILKTVHDALQSRVYTDDRHIVTGSYEKHPDRRNPRVEIVLDVVGERTS